MKNFVVGTLFGIAVATVGFAGLATLLDSGVNQVKQALETHTSK